MTAPPTPPEHRFLLVTADGPLLLDPGQTLPTPTTWDAVRAGVEAEDEPVAEPESVEPVGTEPVAEPESVEPVGTEPPETVQGPVGPGFLSRLRNRRRAPSAPPDQETRTVSPPTPTDPAPSADERLTIEAVLPAALVVHDGQPRAWDPSLQQLVPLGVEDLDALAAAGGGGSVEVDAEPGRRLLATGLARDPGEALPERDHGEPTLLTDLAPKPARGVPSVPEVDGDGRPSVHSVFHTGNDDPCLALGMITANARTWNGGALSRTYDIHRPLPDAEALLAAAAADPRPRILLLSDYLWSTTENLRVGAKLKALSPGSLTIHGGPSAPKYEADCERFLRDNPDVDIVVRGEGEITLAEVLTVLDGSWDPNDLSALAEVPGLSFRGADGSVVRTVDRERMTALDQLPSPYLTGEFDGLPTERRFLATVETNRGCPYGCTFCDWGSATNSRIRSFEVERVEQELEWVARQGIKTVFIADANFGIFERDVRIAQRIVELHERHGYPTTVTASFAKNTIKHTAEIVRILNEGGVRTDAAPALQTTDEATLSIIRRKNLPTEKFDQLVKQFQHAQIPMLTDIMIGLPGSTLETLKKDLDHCADRDITIRFCETFILPNSPMNDPEYRNEHRIRLAPDGRLIETSSYTEQDYSEMLALRKLYRTFDHFGLLRHLLRYVAWDHGIAVSTQLEEIARVARERADEFPHLAYTVDAFDLHATEPGSWPLFFAEVARYYTHDLGIEDGSALRSVLTAQEALIPSRHQRYPMVVRLDHDLVRYELDHLDGAAPHRSLSSYGPAELEVRDPQGLRWTAQRSFELGTDAFGTPRREEHSGNPGFYDMFDWELDSPLKRVLYSHTGIDQTDDAA